jgi:hypothetical protein
MSGDQKETDYHFRKYLESHGFNNLPPLQVMREMDAEVITFSKSITRDYVTDYRHCAETQDHRLEGSKTASTPPYILLADQYCLRITVPISVTYGGRYHKFLHLPN